MKTITYISINKVKLNKKIICLQSKMLFNRGVLPPGHLTTTTIFDVLVVLSKRHIESSLWYLIMIITIVKTSIALKSPGGSLSEKCVETRFGKDVLRFLQSEDEISDYFNDDWCNNRESN